MVTSDDVRRVGLALPRTYEAQVRGRWKLKVKQIVYVAFSRDELDMGFGFPQGRARRPGRRRDPETFFLPPTSDLRYQWVCAHLDRLDQDEMRELVTDAWRMCMPQMLHELPELPAPTAAAWAAMDAGSGASCGRCCIPTCTGPTATSRCAAGATCSQHLAGPPDTEAAARGGGPGRPGLPVGTLTTRQNLVGRPTIWTWPTPHAPAGRPATRSRGSARPTSRR